MTGDTYGPLKVMCEQATLRHYPDALIVRPTYVIGPDDYTMRFPAWVERFAAQQEVECPGPDDAPMQYVDVRDQATFVVDAIEGGLSGVFHCAAPHTTFGQMVSTIRDVVASTAVVRWLPAADCEGRETEFPLWGGGEASPLMQMNPAAAIAAGLVLRPLADTVRDTAAWLGEQSQK
jgi:2'-hydroxyisoflavone reductase